MNVPLLLSNVASVITILAFAWSIWQGFIFRRILKSLFAHDLRALVDQVNLVKADADPATRGKLELLQGNLERLHSKLIDVFGIKNVQKNGP